AQPGPALRGSLGPSAGRAGGDHAAAARAVGLARGPPLCPGSERSGGLPVLGRARQRLPGAVRTRSDVAHARLGCLAGPWLDESQGRNGPRGAAFKSDAGTSGRVLEEARVCIITPSPFAGDSTEFGSRLRASAGI